MFYDASIDTQPSVRVYVCLQETCLVRDLYRATGMSDDVTLPALLVLQNTLWATLRQCCEVLRSRQ